MLVKILFLASLLSATLPLAIRLFFLDNKLQWVWNLGFNSCENIKKFNHRNFLALGVRGKIVLSYNNNYFFLAFLPSFIV